jgi:hypothetical protein
LGYRMWEVLSARWRSVWDFSRGAGKLMEKKGE